MAPCSHAYSVGDGVAAPLLSHSSACLCYHNNISQCLIVSRLSHSSFYCCHSAITCAASSLIVSAQSILSMFHYTAPSSFCLSYAFCMPSALPCNIPENNLDGRYPSLLFQVYPPPYDRCDMTNILIVLIGSAACCQSVLVLSPLRPRSFLFPLIHLFCASFCFHLLFSRRSFSRFIFRFYTPT